MKFDVEVHLPVIEKIIIISFLTKKKKKERISLRFLMHPENRVWLNK